MFYQSPSEEVLFYILVSSLRRELITDRVDLCIFRILSLTISPLLCCTIVTSFHELRVRAAILRSLA